MFLPRRAALRCVRELDLTYLQVTRPMLSCLADSCRWRWRCFVRRAAALLVKAAAAAASGELLPSCVRISGILRRRKAPLLTFDLQMALSLFISLLPAAELAAALECWRR